MSMQNMAPVGQSGWMGTMGPGEGDARGRFILDSDRFKSLDRKQSYFDCTQHDFKKYDFDGRIIDLKGPGAMVTLPLLNAAVSPTYIPLRMRRPSAAMRAPIASMTRYKCICAR